MQTTPQAPPAPAAPGAAAAPSVAISARSITIVGADGKTTTITVPGLAPAIAGTELAPPPVPTEDEFAQGAALGVSMTLLTLGVFALYNWYKRRGIKSEPAQISADSDARFDRLERGIDAIAIEVERISEGQRFVTRMMAEARPPAALSENLPR